MQKGMAAIVAFLLVMAWQYRKNKSLLFVIIATIFPAALFASSRVGLPDWVAQLSAFAWLICMLIAGLLAAEKLFYYIRKKMKHSQVHKGETPKT